MKANELMIGDWVKHGFGYIGKVTELSNGIVTVYDKGLDDGEGNCEVNFAENEIQPISLTPEILEKNGFGYVENDVNAYTGEILSHFYLGEEGYCANMDIHIGTYNEGIFWFNSPMAELHRIRYVHELQHILWLAGVEKEIEL